MSTHAADHKQPLTVPPAPAQESPGRPLDSAARADAERRFGHDFSRVRIHAGPAAAARADALDARAFSVGEHLTFAAGAYAPATAEGRELLTHELAHVVQQAPGRGAPRASAAQAEREAGAVARRALVPLSARPVGVHRQPKTPPPKDESKQKAAPPAGITKAQLAKKLEAILGHPVTITVGDHARQAKDFHLPKGVDKLPDWKAWDPGANSTLYDEIVTAFTDVGREVGGAPDIKEIIFYETHYLFDDATKTVVKDMNAAAQFSSRGVIEVYGYSRFPQGITSGGSGYSWSGVPVAKERSTKKAESPQLHPSTEESQRRALAHELGHGIEGRSGSLDEFEKAVGWSRASGSTALYDIQAKSVKAAIAKDKAPPAAALITKADWNSAKHGEQPISEYSVSDSREDFAESLQAWIYSRDALKVRSPARFAFFDDATRRAAWEPKLVKPGGKKP
jgi:hypothetical protein